MSAEWESLLGIVNIPLFKHYLNTVEKYYQGSNEGILQAGEETKNIYIAYSITITKFHNHTFL